MHKKLESELISLAHQILQMKKKDDVSLLRDKAKDVYEKLSVLAFVDNYFITTPNVTGNKEDFLAKIENSSTIVKTATEPVIEKVTEKVTENVPITKTKEIVKEEVKAVATEKLVEKTIATIKNEASHIVDRIQKQESKSKQVEKNTMAEEMKDSIPADIAANMFEKIETLKKEPIAPKVEKTNLIEPEAPKANIATKQEIVKPATTATKASLNDRISNQKLQIGLNDRIAFVKHLFNFSQEEFNRVLSQLNSFTSEKECIDFLNNVVKPDYDWSTKVEYEDRLIKLIERKFA